MSLNKKYAAAAMSLLLCFSALSTPAAVSFADNEDETSAADTESDILYTSDFGYTITDDDTICIESCGSHDEEVTVPEEIDGKKVTELGVDAFAVSTVKKINLPASVNYISSENPFVQCTSLEEINVDASNPDFCSVDGVLFTKDKTRLIFFPPEKSADEFDIPEGVTSLATAAFYFTSLKKVVFPSTVTAIERHCFGESASLESVDMSKSKITEIPVMAFVQCTALKDVVFSQSTTTISLAAFMYCSSLENVDLPESLVYVGQSAFLGTAMKKIIVPDSVESIGYNAFGYDENESAISDFVIVGSYGSAAYTYSTDVDEEYGYKNEFEFVPNETNSIIEQYENMDKRTSGDYEYSVNNGEATILVCNSMADTLIVPNEIDGCPVTAIFPAAFAKCECSELILPDTVKTIGEAVFPDYLVTLTIPGGCTSIEGEEPFLTCTYLREITVTEGAGNYSSKDGVLYNKDKTKLIAYPQAKEDKKFKLPDSVTEIEFSAFCGSTHLESIDMKNVTAIGNYAFENCSALNHVGFSKDLVSVGHDAFYNCTSLKSVRLYDKLETIGDYAFGFKYDPQAAAEAAENNENISSEEETNTDAGSVKIDDFKIYTDKDTLAYKYAKSYDIETVTDTVSIGNTNVNKGFLITICSIIGAAILAVIGFITGKSLKKKKEAKKQAEAKAKAKEKREADKKKQAASESEQDGDQQNDESN